MNCFVCNAVVDDSVAICPFCGNILKESAVQETNYIQEQPKMVEAPQPQVAPQQPVLVQPAQPQTAPQQPYVTQHVGAPQFTPQAAPQQPVSVQPAQPQVAETPRQSYVTQHVGAPQFTPQAAPQQTTLQPVSQPQGFPPQQPVSQPQGFPPQQPMQQAPSPAQMQASASQATNGMPPYQYMKQDPTYIPQQSAAAAPAPQKKSKAGIIIAIAAACVLLIGGITAIVLILVNQPNKNLTGGAPSEDELASKVVEAINNHDEDDYLDLIPDDMETSEIVDSADELFDTLSSYNFNIDTYDTEIASFFPEKIKEIRKDVKEYSGGKLRVNGGCYLTIIYSGLTNDGKEISGELYFKVIQLDGRYYICDMSE